MDRYTQYIQIHGKSIEEVLQDCGFAKFNENYTSPSTGQHYSNVLEFLPAFFERGRQLNLPGFDEYAKERKNSLALMVEPSPDGSDLPDSSIVYYPYSFDSRLPEYLSKMLQDELFHFVAYSPFAWADCAIVNFKDGETMTNGGKKITATINAININTQLRKNSKGSYLLSVPTGNSETPFIKTLITEENIHRYPESNICDVLLTHEQILAIYPNNQYKTVPAKEFERSYYIAKAAYRDYMTSEYTITGIPSANFRHKENEGMGSIYYVISLPVNMDFSPSGNIYLTSTPEACSPEEGTLTLYELGKKRSVYVANEDERGDAWTKTEVNGFSIVEAATGVKIKVDTFREQAESYFAQRGEEMQADIISTEQNAEEHDEEEYDYDEI